MGTSTGGFTEVLLSEGAAYILIVVQCGGDPKLFFQT
jgi:predicted rRNA methylase YqxC with S4 and FtsJ domains